MIGSYSIAFAVAALLLSFVPARADDGAIIDRWYSALLVADRTELSEPACRRCPDKARRSRRRAERSRNSSPRSTNGKGAVAGAAIRHRIEKTEAGVTTVIACYDFPNNDMLMQETFAVAGNRITASSQAAIAENCDGF